VTAYLSAPAYVLGETEVAWSDVDGLRERAAQWRMPVLPDLWGWGVARRTSRGLDELFVEAGKAALDAAGLDPAAVSALVLCSTRFPGGPDTHGSFVSGVTGALGLADAAVFGLTLNRCTTFLGGIDLAAALVAAGRHRCVLVVTADRVDDEAARLERFALFSDGAAACVVADAPWSAPAYDVVACASAQVNTDLDWSHEISSDLGRVVNDALLKPADLALSEVAGLLHANLFLPVVAMKERQAGYAAGQLDTANVARVGHCFGADPLINLADRAAAGRVRPGEAYVLAVSVPGVRHGVLLRVTS
jgi:3-oxoacyl-[acyl-carrier-protein] synthase III